MTRDLGESEMNDPWRFRRWILHLTDVVGDMDYWPDNWWVDRDRFHKYVYQGA